MPRLRLDPFSPSGVSFAPEPTKVVSQGHGYVSKDITGMVTAGSNVTLTGNGTTSSPYQIASTGATGPAGTTDHLLLSNIGTNTHTQIDTALSTNTAAIAANTTAIATKQATLVSGTNLKTVNGSTLLGSGDLTINAGVWGGITGTLSAQTDLNTALNAKASTTYVDGLVAPLASTTYVDTSISNVLGTVGPALDTLGELSDALGDDANYAATMTTSLAGKASTTYVDTQDAGLQSQITSNTTAITGKVTGPASATDNAIARYDATTGKLVQDSTTTIDDSGNMRILGSLVVNKEDGSFGIDDPSNTTPRIGMVKKSGDGPFFAVGSGTTFTVKKSSTGAITPGSTYTNLLNIATNGSVTTYGRLDVGGEITAYNGTYTDPAPAVGYDAKFGGTTNGIAVTGASLFKSTVSSNGFNPNTTASYTLGTSSLYWSNLYATRHYLNATAYIDGASAGIAAFTGAVTTTGNATVTGGQLSLGATGVAAKLTAVNGATDFLEYDTVGGVTMRSFTNRSISITAGGTGDIAVGQNSISTFKSLGAAPVVNTLVLSAGLIGLGTTAPTHTLTLPSTATGIAWHNVADQTTNYERARAYWASNVYTIATEKGGTGTNRNIALVPAGGTVTVTGGLTATASVGYATGAGGTVTQATSKATAVTLSKTCGTITLSGASLAADTTVSFTLTNTTIAVGDVVILNHTAVGAFGSYNLNARSAAGSATIDVRNITTGALAEAIVISFAVIKAVTA
jgi:hypothetical protein